MLASAIAFILLTQGGDPPTQSTTPPAPASTDAQAAPTPPDPAKLVSAMLSHYFRAESVTGTILLTTSAGGVSGQVLTTLSFQTPAYLYLRQDMVAATKRSWLILCDGTDFEYPVPQGMPGSEVGRMLTEPLSVEGGVTSFRDVYKIGAQGIKDRSAPLEIAFSVSDEMRNLKRELTTLNYTGQTTIRGQLCNVIEGYWSEGGRAKEEQYRMAITPDGDLMQYEIYGTVSYSVGNKQIVGPLQVDEVWDVDLKVNKPVDTSVFHF